VILAPRASWTAKKAAHEARVDSARVRALALRRAFHIRAAPATTKVNSVVG
jgi:hypothetical protein